MRRISAGWLEVAEHERDAPVGQQVRVGLVARAAEVEVGDAPRRQHPEAVVALRAEVDPRALGRGGDEEHRLRGDHRHMVPVAQRVEEIGHAGDLRSVAALVIAPWWR
jgi:hypothetical protein